LLVGYVWSRLLEVGSRHRLVNAKQTKTENLRVERADNTAIFTVSRFSHRWTFPYRSAIDEFFPALAPKVVQLP
jgi:hypothetical protein